MAGHSNRRWKVVLLGVEEPDVMKMKVQSCLFFRRRDEPKSVAVVDANVVATFPATLDKKDVLKKCSQSFKPYGRYIKHEVTDLGEAEAPSHVSAPSASASGEPPDAQYALAIRSPVEEIMRMGRDLTRAEHHTLAVFFAARYGQHVQRSELGATVTVLAAKRAASAIFRQQRSGRSG